MDIHDKQRKAVSLISGGLDSLLATKAMLEQGIHVEGINFFTGFCVEGHTHAIRKKDKAKPKRNNALWVAEQLGIKLHIIDIVDEYKDVVINPKHGYGANLNPCLDCKIFMVNKAKQWMMENDFDFMITGEVIGQRPMSQRKETMPIIANESGADDLLLRPLCAKNLPATKPELENWIDREKLYGFSGRSRKPQIALANHWGFDEYAQPAGGCCFLTDPNYSDKLKDLWQNRGDKYYELDDIMLLKTGRHLRPKKNFKLIIAREEGETRFMEGYKNKFIWLKTASCAGPLTLMDGNDISADDIELAARITARYSQGRDEECVTIATGTRSKAFTEFDIKPMLANEIQALWYL
ncbi:MAG TPA: tRNA (5-methylaminomethyl-2-thiouridylate)-methyltransferase [Thiothrix sp.]|nr:tRNA (5-methylaminomethyl-2-thiouridylate)-methyltransferase [Thiothrix sp.]